MIKLLFFIDTTLSSGGAEKVLRTLVNNMDRRRFDITVMTSWPENAKQYLAQGIRYKSLYPSRNRFWRFVSRLEAALGLTYRLRMAGDYDLEIAYLEFGPTKILASSTNRRARKLAWVHCQLDKMDGDIDALQRKSAAWYPKFDKVVCVSNTVRSSFVRMFGKDPESVVLHNVVDSTDILTKAAAPIPDCLKKRRLTVVTVGRLYSVKGYDRLLSIHDRLLREDIDHDLWILGEGPLRPELESYIREHDLTDSVRMPGFLPNPYPCISAADVVVCSSLYEGFSTMVTEALILGKPVVTTDCSGMDELLGNNEYGLITENNEESLYLGLKRMLTEPELLLHYADRAEVRGKNFCLENLVRKTEQFFIETLEGTRSE